MLFWIVALVIALLVAGLIALALLRRSEGDTASDVAFYKDQLAEVDRDVARGVLPEAEAERARTEIARRLLEADKADQVARAPHEAPKSATAVAAGLAALLIVGGGAGLYWRLGAPGYPDLPIKLRIAMADEARADRPDQKDAEESLGVQVPQAVDPEHETLVQRLRDVVAERPADVQGLTLLARNEAALGNMVAAHEAQARLIDAKGEDATAQDFSALAHFLVLAAGGYVSPEAEAALTEALRRDQTDQPARYYSGLLFAQTGRPDLAFRFWSSLLAESEPDAPWIPPIRAQIEEIAMLAGQNDFVLPDTRGPSAADMQAAAGMSAEDRDTMIRGMVEQLSDRLATEGGPASEWAKLIRAYGVLGEGETALPVLQEARLAFADDPAGLEQIEAAARDAGLIE